MRNSSANQCGIGTFRLPPFLLFLVGPKMSCPFFCGRSCRCVTGHRRSGLWATAPASHPRGIPSRIEYQMPEDLNHLDLICEALDCEPDEILVRVQNPEPRVGIVLALRNLRRNQKSVYKGKGGFRAVLFCLLDTCMKQVLL